MRHLRIPGQNIKNLAAYQSQLVGLLRGKRRYERVGRNEGAGSHPSSSRSNTSTSRTKSKSSKRKRPIKGTQDNPKKRLRKYTSKSKEGTVKKKIKYRNTVAVKRPLYKCTTCNATESVRRNMLKHLETHTGIPISCLRCKQTFNGSVSYNWHLVHYCKSRVSQKTEYKCEQCSRKCSNSRSLLAHIRGHKRNNCTYCDMVLTRRTQLAKHLLEVHQIKLESKSHKCDHCEKRYINKRNMYYHLKQHFADKIVCLECGKIEDTLESFEEHKRQHDLLKNFVCVKCGERFMRRQQYLFHLNGHNRYRCITCDEHFASREKALHHKQQSHEVDGLQPRFICPHCPAAYHRERLLFLHLKKHNGDIRSLNCKYCKKNFTSPYSYYKHCMTISHEKFSPEVCDVSCQLCGKRFLKKGHLKHHMYNVHKTRQKYSCKHCLYMSFHKCNMERHASLHFTKKEFTCEHCGNNFDSLASLKDHISYKHLLKKEFKCEKCSKSFKRNSELVRHRNSHSDERPYVCTLCSKAYKRQNHLKRHEQSTHEIVGPPRTVKRLVSDAVTSEVPQTLGTKSKIAILYQHSITMENGTLVVKNELTDGLFTNISEINDGNSSAYMVDQLVSSFVPERDWGLGENEALYKVYNDVALNYSNQQLPVISDSIIESSLPKQSGDRGYNN